MPVCLRPVFYRGEAAVVQRRVQRCVHCGSQNLDVMPRGKMTKCTQCVRWNGQDTRESDGYEKKMKKKKKQTKKKKKRKKKKRRRKKKKKKKEKEKKKKKTTTKKKEK
jgi:hypothetical protein